MEQFAAVLARRADVDQVVAADGGDSPIRRLLDIGDGVVEVKATSGDNHLGGDDWDERVVSWLVDKFKAANGIDLTPEKLKGANKA